MGYERGTLALSIQRHVDRKDATAVIRKAEDIVREHPRYLRDTQAIDDTPVFVLHKDGNPDREIKLALVTVRIHVRRARDREPLPQDLTVGGRQASSSDVVRTARMDELLVKLQDAQRVRSPNWDAFGRWIERQSSELLSDQALVLTGTDPQQILIVGSGRRPEIAVHGFQGSGRLRTGGWKEATAPFEGSWMSPRRTLVPRPVGYHVRRVLTQTWELSEPSEACWVIVRLANPAA